ncbi:DnaJ domain-containing protein [Shewanella sp. TC10]|uniref:DnaJ domain-containing protein n=1 Tax=Shewanella sp. TC10 TaxID=1419739 RepID=UPI00129E4914|nr:DnaJ domain-containing protein [Shewanella sp. TC10]
MENLYLSLGLSQDSDDDAITTAYESLYLFYHSDEYQSAFADIDIKLANIAVSYDILKCPIKRKSYDEMWQHYQAEKTLDALVDVPDMSYEFEVDAPIMEQWPDVVEQHPHLIELYDNLASLSTVLALSFKAYILESERFEEAERLAYIMCAQYIQCFFDEEQNIKPLAKGLLTTNSPADVVTVDELFDAQGIELSPKPSPLNDASGAIEPKSQSKPHQPEANIASLPLHKHQNVQRLLSKDTRALRHASKKATAKGSLFLLGLFFVSNIAA